MGQHYTPAERDRALLELAICGGNSARASERLAATGLPVPDQTLRDWRLYKHAERYSQLSEQHARQVEDVIVQQARESALLAGELEREIMTRLATELDDLPARDKAATVRNLSTSKGINVDKLLTLTGRPTQVTEHRNADDLLRKLQTLRINAIDSTAEDLHDTQLAADSSVSNARELPAAT